MASLIWPVGAAFAVALLLALYFATSTFSKDEPRPVPYRIPVLGHAIEYSRNRRTLLKRLDAERNHEPFTLFIAGRKHHVFHKPGEYAEVFKNSKTLSIGVFVRLLHRNWFGFSEEMSFRLTTGDVKPIHHQANNVYLLRAENNAVTASQYFEEVERAAQELDEELARSETKRVTKDAMDFIIHMQGKPTTTAYFGPETLKINPGMLNDICIFNREGFWPLLFGLPRLLVPKPYEARDRILACFTRVVELALTQDDTVSPFIQHRLANDVKAGFDKADLARDLFSLFFGVNSNSMPNAYIALLHLASDPELVATFRAELKAAGYSTLSRADLVQIIPEQVPRMRAFLQESLRMHINSTTIREVLEDTTLRMEGHTWHLKKGSVVNLPGSLLALDPTIRDSPEQFIPTRFLDKTLGGMGENFAKTVKPFGGGTSYCPGRVFAEKQILGSLSAMIMRYDMRIVTEGYKIPEDADFEYVLGQPRVEVEIKRRS